MKLTHAVLFAFFMALADVSRAAVDEWTQLGPEIGNIRSIAASHSDSNLVYAGKTGGVYKSSNGGLSWEYHDLYASTYSVDVIEFDPVDDDVVYVGTTGGWMQKTTDGGENWDVIPPLPLDPFTWRLQSFEVAPSDRDRLYFAGTDFNAGITTSFFVSEDAGASWTEKVNGLPTDQRAWDIVVHPTDEDIVFASMFVEGVSGNTMYVTTDGGDNWNPVTNQPMQDLGGGLMLIGLRSIEIDPVDTTKMYGVRRGNLFTSTDSGQTWAITYNSTAPNPFLRQISFDPFDSNRLILTDGGADTSGVGESVLISNDSGASFAASDAGFNTVRVNRISVSGTQDVLYAATVGGVHRSTDGGMTWHQRNNGIFGSEVKGVAVHPTDEKTLYISVTGMGVMKSTDGGYNWDVVSVGLPLNPSQLEIAATDPDILYVGTGVGIWRSDDAGVNWTQTDVGTSTDWFVLHPTDPSTLYVANANRLKRSTDSGVTFDEIHPGAPGASDIDAIGLDPTTPATVYLGRNNGDIFKSTDGGDTWSAMAIGNFGSVSPIVIEVSAQNADEIYVGAGGGVYKSINGGVDWNNVHTFGFAWSIAIDPVDPQVIYRGSFAVGAFRTVDSGANWAKLTDVDDLINGSSVWRVRVDPNNHERAYAASADSGLFMTGPEIPPPVSGGGSGSLGMLSLLLSLGTVFLLRRRPSLH